jgi:hypothetical protein
MADTMARRQNEMISEGRHRPGSSSEAGCSRHAFTPYCAHADAFFTESPDIEPFSSSARFAAFGIRLSPPPSTFRPVLLHFANFDFLRLSFSRNASITPSAVSSVRQALYVAGLFGSPQPLRLHLLDFFRLLPPRAFRSCHVRVMPADAGFAVPPQRSSSPFVVFFEEPFLRSSAAGSSSYAHASFHFFCADFLVYRAARHEARRQPAHADEVAAAWRQAGVSQRNTAFFRRFRFILLFFPGNICRRLYILHAFLFFFSVLQAFTFSETAVCFEFSASPPILIFTVLFQQEQL